GHLTALVQVYRTQILTRTSSTRKGARRPSFKPSPSPLSATRRVVCLVGALLVLGTDNWAQFRAQFGRSIHSPFKVRKENDGGRRFLGPSPSSTRAVAKRWAPPSHYCGSVGPATAWSYSCRSAVSGSM